MYFQQKIERLSGYGDCMEDIHLASVGNIYEGYDYNPEVLSVHVMHVAFAHYVTNEVPMIRVSISIKIHRSFIAGLSPQLLPKPNDQGIF